MSSLPSDAMELQKGFDSRELRNCLGAFVTGVAVITTVDAAGRWHGLTVNSFTSVSLDPPLILWCQQLRAPSLPAFREARSFAVNILAKDQIEISRRFSTPTTDKFAGVEVLTGLGGVPLIAGCAAYLECSTKETFPGGDHVVFLGHVEGIKSTQRPPLVFGFGGYMVVQPHQL